MSTADLAKAHNKTLAETIDAAFERREEIGPATKSAVREAVERRANLVAHRDRMMAMFFPELA